MCPGVVWNSFLVYDALVIYLSIILHLCLNCVAQVYYVHCVPFVHLFLYNLFLLIFNNRTMFIIIYST